ncbi:Ig-like domain-containing protein [Lacticaseibacillus paracasei]|uniref:Ig-like domain-containing protein n=1 Tax=Lacticaseibacillus paracasei TaxID=1597 RepID=UPI003F616835
MKVQINPADAANKQVTFKTSDSSIATVSSDGTVTGVKVGSATVTVTTYDGGKTATATITVA